MFIKKIQLKNWQAHENFEIKFNADVNIITGQSDAGKSCIRRAIEWILFNANISEQSYRREGTKETSVTIWLDNGFEIERIRSNTLNRYILRHKDIEEKIFDSFGKVIPDEVQQAIGLSEIEIDSDKINLNVSEQIKLPFLLDKPASFRSKLFNKLTGNEVLDKLFKELNKYSLKFKREISETEELSNKQEEQLVECSLHYKTLKKQLSSVNEEYNKLKEDVAIYESLKNLSEQLKENKTKTKEIKDRASQIQIISEDKVKKLREKAEKLKILQHLFCELEAINDEIRVTKKKTRLVKSVKFDEKELVKSAETLQKLRRLDELIIANIEAKQNLALDKKFVKENLANNEAELDAIWKEQKICPLCNREMENE